jgi:hypothetical protein
MLLRKIIAEDDVTSQRPGRHRIRSALLRRGGHTTTAPVHQKPQQKQWAGNTNPGPLVDRQSVGGRSRGPKGNVVAVVDRGVGVVR